MTAGASSFPLIKIVWAANKITSAFAHILAKAVSQGMLCVARNHMLVASH